MVTWLRTAMLAVSLAVVVTTGVSRADAASPTTTLISVAPGGANDDSDEVSVAAGGRFVAFSSKASNLVPGDTNGVRDVFVRDTTTGTTERIVAPDGSPGEEFSSADLPHISADGRYVLFESDDELNGTVGIFLRDRELATTTLIQDGEVAYSTMSRNGRYIGWGAYRFTAYVYRLDRRTGKVLTRKAGRLGDDMAVLGLSNDGRTALIGNLDREQYRIWKPLTGKLKRFDQARGGGYANAPVTGVTLSANGRYVMFDSKDSNLVRGDTNHHFDVFVRNLSTRHTARISRTTSGGQANGVSYGLDISGGGRYRLFASRATNLVPGDTNGATDLFIRDRVTGTTTRCDVTAAGAQADTSNRALYGALSPSGSWIGIASTATNLIPGDANGHEDVFLRGPGC